MRARLQALGEAEFALVLAKALAPEFDPRKQWFEGARGILANGELRRQWRTKELGKVTGRLEREGFVEARLAWHGPSYGMRLDTVFEVLDAAHDMGRLEPAMRRAWTRPEEPHADGAWSWCGSALSRARALLVIGEVDAAMRLLARPVDRTSPDLLEPGMPRELRVFGTNPRAVWLQAASADMLAAYGRGLGNWCYAQLVPVAPEVIETILEELGRRSRRRSPPRPPVELVRAAVLMSPGPAARALLDALTPASRRKLEVLDTFVRGDLHEAHRRGNENVAASTAKTPKLGHVEGVAYLLTCIDAVRRGDRGGWATFDEALQLERARADQDRKEQLSLLEEVAAREAASDYEADHGHDAIDLEALFSTPRPWLTVLLAGLLVRWFRLDVPRGLEGSIEHFAVRAQRVDGGSIVGRTLRALGGASDLGGPTLLDVYAPRPTWEHMLDHFESLAERIAPGDGHDDAMARTGASSASLPAFEPHVVWQLDRGGELDLQVTPRIVSSPRARHGRPVRARDLLESESDATDSFDELVARRTARRRQLIEIEVGSVERIPGAQAWIALETLLALDGHPRVRGPEGQHVVVERRQPRLVVSGDEEGAELSIEPPELQGRTRAFEWLSRDHLAVYELDDDTAAVVAALRTVPGGRVPPEAMAKLRPVLARLAGSLIIEGRGSANLEGDRVVARAEIDVDLEWRDPTLTVAVGVRPLGVGGPRCEPGAGSVEIRGEVDGVHRSARRDLALELASFERALVACPRLEALEVDDDGVRFVMGYDAAIPLLEELTAAARRGELGIGWPRGKPLSLPPEYGSEAFEMRVRKGRPNWLAVEAGLRVDDDEVLPWRLLAEHRMGSGRYVRLGDDEVIALSKSLQRRLHALAQLDHTHPRVIIDGELGGATVPELCLPVIDELLGDGEPRRVGGSVDGPIALDGEVATRLAELRAALDSEPPLPDGLQVTLRDYQREGYRWMARLAAAGLGGILADDMGLGKTVQTLALLQARRDAGPALVVCPTSVGPNWRAEAARFAPMLRVVELRAVAPEHRRAALENLGPGEVGVLSYGLLGRMEADLAGLRLATVVFDEAHALKNAKSRRARAAGSIDADFRLGLTGTPIENHLGELWSVMQACVPGLLGDQDWFNRRIARPIEEDTASVASYLRALIRPFILRRTKEKVLTELPARTENVVMVEPTREERAWYEAQRRLAEERVRKMAKERGKKRGQARIAMLAEIMRLRRGAVDPRLVDDLAPGGAKLGLVVDRASELVSAGHQVLVFTQFLEVIERLGGRLARAGVRVLELQGATPAGERARRIEAFQRGEADVFLMSLKAGGVGVNLTAADYVLHVDPWWNPAVEDQATGRAHRMGQSRPVTVYRFCTAGSIEPRILDLHHEKRELAEDLLTGMEKSKRLDLDELRGLLGGG